MGNLSLTYLPPQNWQDFEKFVRGVVDVIWKQEGWQSYGRPGQDQAGIDLFGYDEQRQFAAIQCKKRNLTNSSGRLLTNSLLTQKLFEADLAVADAVDDPKIKRLIFATTSSRDTNVQDTVRSINDRRKTEGKFLIEVWFWDDFQVYIERHIELMYWYYSDVLESVHKYDKNIHIFTMLRQAFTRPAFGREIHREESGSDFIQAIKNTMEAITTGKLYNRRGELIASSYDYRKITEPKWRDVVYKIHSNLNRIRDIYQDGLLAKSIKEHPTCLEVFDNSLSVQFNEIRRQCLADLNVILAELKLEKVNSELLRK
jgi:hypothetical protein